MRRARGSRSEVPPARTGAYAGEANGVNWLDSLAVVRSASMPALPLEAGVIVNREEALRLRDPAVIKRIAGVLAEGVKACPQ